MSAALRATHTINVMCDWVSGWKKVVSVVSCGDQPLFLLQGFSQGVGQT